MLTHRGTSGHRRRSAVLATAAFLVVAATLSAPAVPAQARDLVVFAEPTLAPALDALGKAWRRHGGAELRVFKSPTVLALAQADRHIRCDVVVGLAGPAFAKADKDETIDSDTTAAFAANTLVLIAQGDPERWTAADGAVAALLAGKRLAIADPDRDLAGRYAIAALRAAGLTIDPLSRSIAVAESSAGVITLLAEKRADVGIVFATDAREEGFVHPRMLADNTYPKIDYLIAAVDEPQRTPDDFLAFVRSEEARAILATAGLQPPDRNTLGPATKAKAHDDQ
jgi:molybdenum ABC transporter molybdate-binding protein